MKDLAAPRSTDGISYCEPSIANWTRTENAMGNILPSHPGRHPDRHQDGTSPSEPPRLAGRWEISPQVTRTESRMGEIRASHPDSQPDGKYPREPLGSGLNARYPSALPGPRVDGKYPREPRAEGSMGDFPAGPGSGPGVGHSAAPTWSPRLGCSLRQAGEARPGSCREVKRRKGTSPPPEATAA